MTLKPKNVKQMFEIFTNLSNGFEDENNNNKIISIHEENWNISTISVISTTTTTETSSLSKANIIDEDEYISAIDIINFFFMLVGVFTNLICICIFSQKSLLKRKFNWYLLVLSVLDLTFCIVLSSDYAYRLASTKTMFLHELNIYISITMDFIAHTSDSLTIILTLILSIDRLYAITNPIKNKYFMTNTHTKAIISTSLLIVCIIRLPSAIVCRFCYDKECMSCIISCSFLLPILINILPAFIILILNGILVGKLFKYNMKKLSIKSTKDGKTYVLTNTKINKIKKSTYFIILTMALWLLTTNTPYYAIFVYQFGYNSHLKGGNFKFTFDIQHITSVLFNLNHCINLFIYMCYHEAFRATILKLFKVKTCKTDYTSLIIKIQNKSETKFL
jgi:hypothetical protein